MKKILSLLIITIPIVEICTLLVACNKKKLQNSDISEQLKPFILNERVNNIESFIFKKLHNKTGNNTEIIYEPKEK